LIDNNLFEYRFQNWLHWCQLKGIYHGKAGSAEGRYRSPQTWEPQNPKPAWLIAMDVNDAVLLNRAYSQLGDRTRRTIKVLFIKTGWRPQWQAQAIGCHWKELDERGHQAKRMMENRLRQIEGLTRQEHILYKDTGSHNSDTQANASIAPVGELLSLKERA
jgi:hypothetical protein